MLWILRTIILICLYCKLYGTPIEINEGTEYAIMDRFFRMMICNSSYGYVLEGAKPIDAANILPMDHLIAPQSIFFQSDVCAREMMKLWKKIAPINSNIVLKSTEVFDQQSHVKATELLFINVSKLKEEIEKNIDLFRYVLGPGIDASKLVEHIVESPKSLDSILKGDNVLNGIVLGFGAYNSLMHSRAEAIQNAALNSHDIPPFTRQNEAMNQEGPCQLSDSCLRLFGLSLGCPPHDADRRIFIESSLGFASLDEELRFIQSCKEGAPETLLREAPRFVFATYQNINNQKLIKDLECTQQRIKKILEKPNFLEIVLEKITGEKPKINCTISPQALQLEIQEDVDEIIAKSVYQLCCQLDQEVIPDFIQSFCQCNLETRRVGLGAMPGLLACLKRAKLNLQLAETQFATCPQTKHLEEIVVGYLYFERNKVGDGQLVNSADQVRVSYVIEDGCGNILSADHNCWIDLSNTIPGFAHGLKGMQEGEMRTLFIHPSLAYGAITTLSPCTSLVVKITLHQVDQQRSTKSLPSLNPIDLAWVKDPQFYQEVEETCHTLARALGSRWGIWLSKSPNINFAKLCACLKHLADAGESLNKKEMIENEPICNRVFWNLISAPACSRIPSAG